jgi:hypothetical protein
MLPLFYDSYRCDAWLYESETQAQEVDFERELKNCEDFFGEYTYTEEDARYLAELLEKAASVRDLEEWQEEALALA